jgi:TPR repeat protein
MMKVLCFVFTLAMPIYIWAAESCNLEDIGLTSESSLPERLFYEGTCHYRNQDYDKSIILWRELSKLPKVEAKFYELQISSLNNLGYLLFFGYGTKENKLEALQLWNKAVSLGHTEAEYHLCHAYADSRVSTYNPAKAIAHCEKAKLIYQGVKNPDSSDKTILNQINKYLFEIKNQ